MSAAAPTTFPPTQTLSGLKLFGRKYSLIVTLPPDLPGGNQTVLTLSDSSFEPEALRVTFDVRTVFFQAAWWAEIVIYNLDQTTTQQLIAGTSTGQGVFSPPPTVSSSSPIKQGMVATLSAGYQHGNYGVIWTGPVFQALFVRENVTDYKITLNCLLWLDPLTRTSLNLTFGAPNFNQTALIQHIAQAAFGSTFGQPTISPNISPKTLPRGKTIFGSAAKYLNQMADDNNMQWFLSQRGLVFGKVDEGISATEPAARVFTPETGLIGTPQQTQYGVDFRVLLDPTVVVKYPAMLVNIDNSQIIQLKKSIGEYPSILDQNGTYIVSGVRYVGDTRGTPWYTEITGFTSVGGKWAAAQFLSNAPQPIYNR